VQAKDGHLMTVDRALTVVAALLLTGGLVLLAAGIWAGEDRGAR